MINIKRFIGILLILIALCALYWMLFLRVKRTDASQVSYYVKPSCTPTPSPSPSPSWEPEPSSTPEGTPEATRTPSPTPGLTDPQGPFDAASQPACVEIKYAPTVGPVKRIDADSIHIEWSKVDEGINHYKIEYSLFKGIVMWNTIVENTNEKDLNFLPAWLPIWVHVAGVSPGGCVGNYSVWVDP